MRPNHQRWLSDAALPNRRRMHEACKAMTGSRVDIVQFGRKVPRLVAPYDEGFGGREGAMFSIHYRMPRRFSHKRPHI